MNPFTAPNFFTETNYSTNLLPNNPIFKIKKLKEKKKLKRG